MDDSASYMDSVLHSVAKRLILCPDSALEMCLESGLKDLRLTRRKCKHLLSNRACVLSFLGSSSHGRSLCDCRHKL